MKIIAAFLDESGNITDECNLMNITGIVTVAPSREALVNFNRSLYSSVAKAGLLAGFCDGGSERIVDTEKPSDSQYLRKRAAKGWELQHRMGLIDFIEMANGAARKTQTDIGVFTLKFPGHSRMPWRTSTDWENQLLDRTYLERLRDSLELLFFECPWVVKHLDEPCEVCLDLPTRTATAELPLQPDLRGCSRILWRSWGLNNDGESDGELRTGSLTPSDGAEILTSVLSRRPHLPPSVTIARARCVRLMDWEAWGTDCPGKDSRNKWDQKYVAPKQVHYLADLLAYSVYSGDGNQTIHKHESVQPWYDRGYHLDAGMVDPWIEASRRFANGERVAALRLLMEGGADMGEEAEFFRQRSQDWFSQLGSEELRELFQVAKARVIRMEEPQAQRDSGPRR